ncbi:MAG: DUF711 family protein [Christensenellales bacterium]
MRWNANAGNPIVNKRISVTPASLVAAACGDPVVAARAMDAAAKETGVNWHWRLYGAGAEGAHDRLRPRADRISAGGAFHHRARLLVGQSFRFHRLGAWHRRGRGSARAASLSRFKVKGYRRRDGG